MQLENKILILGKKLDVECKKVTKNKLSFINESF